MAKNITLAVDEKVLEKVRKYGAANNTTLNALVRESLAALATRSHRADKAWDALFDQIDREGAEMGNRTWTGDDLYVR
jgi:hypothetical protein